MRKTGKLLAIGSLIFGAVKGASRAGLCYHISRWRLALLQSGYRPAGYTFWGHFEAALPIFLPPALSLPRRSSSLWGCQRPLHCQRVCLRLLDGIGRRPLLGIWRLAGTARPSIVLSFPSQILITFSQGNLKEVVAWKFIQFRKIVFWDIDLGIFHLKVLLCDFYQVWLCKRKKTLWNDYCVIACTSLAYWSYGCHIQ